MVEYLDVVIREVNRMDYARLTHFLDQNNVVEVIRHFHPFPLNADTSHYITCTSHLDRYYVALSGDEIVGLCMLRGWDDGHLIPSFGVLVDRHFWNRGIGKKMTEFAIREAKNMGCVQVRLSVYASNESALCVYRSLGFIEHARESVEVMGQPDEKIIMFKEL